MFQQPRSPIAHDISCGTGNNRAIHGRPHQWIRTLQGIAAVVFGLALAGPAAAISPDVVISQVYGGGGNSGATLKNDFIELHNAGSSPVSLNGWSVQYASATGTSWQVTTLSGTLQPGQYYLVQEAAGTGGTANLPTPDATGTIAMSGSNGKVALVASTTALTGTCPSGTRDLVGYGSANCSETGATAALTNTTAAIRTASCTDTDNNSSDFTTGAPTPRNALTPFAPCAAPLVNGECGGDNGLTLTATAPTNLCVVGTPTSVSGSGHPWSWTCDGIGGGTTASCSASIQSYALNFATDGNGTLSGITAQSIDYGASATAVSANANSGYSFVNWTGTNGFVTTTANPLTVANVTAAQDLTAHFTNAPIAGVCGAADGQARATAPSSELCATGAASAVSGSGPWSWSCSGLNGGAAASCSASLDSTSHFRDFAPIADAQVVEASPTTNYATGTSMYVASANGGSFMNQRIWSAYDLAGKLPPGASITSARLRMYVYKSAASALPVAVHASNDDSWTESGITWSTQPAFDGTPVVTGDMPANGEYKWVEFDVTPYVLARLATSTRMNLVLKAANEGAASWISNAIDSKEFNVSLAPRLRIEYAGGAWPDDKVNIIHVNDIHSRLTTHDLDFPDGPGESPAFEEAGGAARMAAKMLQLKSANMNSLVLDAGDISEGGPLGDLRINGGMVDYLGNIDAQLKALPGAGGRGLDAIVIGNHDVRDAQMLTNMQASGLPFISVNLLNNGAAVPAPAAQPAANPFKPYVVVNTQSTSGNPVKVAVLGYLTDDSAILSDSTDPLIDVKETRWSDNDPGTVDLKDWVAHLRKPAAQGGEGADIVVLLSHVGHRRYNSGDEILLGDGEVSPPDLVVSGHWHTWGKTAWQPSNLNANTVVVEAASYAQYVGEVQLTPQGEYLSAQKHPVKAAEIAPNLGVQTLINNLIAEYDAQLDPAKACVLPPSDTGRTNPNQPCPLEHVVGHSAVDLKLDKDKWFTLSEFPWSGDNAAGEWIADATVWKLNQISVPAQLALQSGGGVRRDVKAGPVTYLDIYETYPWTDDQIRVVTLTSADIWNYLESHYVGSSISQGWQVTADDGVITAVSYNGTPLSKTDTSTTWQVAISEYMFLHDDWISESGTQFDFASKPNTAYTTSIRNAVVEYTSQFTAANPMTVPGPRYVLNTELAGGFKAVVTMVSDAENEPYFEGIFVRLLEALPETLARRNGYGLSGLVNADGSINPGHEFAETMLYRSHLGFPDGVLKVGDIIEVWGEGGFFAGNPQLVDQETVHAPGKEFSVLGYDESLAQPAFMPDTASFFNEAYENRLVKFRAVRTGDKQVTDASGVQINVYKEGGFYSVTRLPGNNGDLLELVGVQTHRTGSSPDRRFRLREVSVVPASGNGSGYLPFSAVDAVAPNPVASGPITLTANASDAGTGGNGTLSIAPVADAQVASGNPTTNYGTSTNLYIQSATSGFGNERDWLRFDLASALPTGATATGARLKLFQWRASGTGLPVAVHGSSDTAWGETAITWDTQPAFDPSALATQTVATTNTWYSWNVGSYVAGKSSVSFVAKPVTENANPASAAYAFDAREFGSNAPALEVDYTAPVSAASVTSVQFFYRHAADGLNWGAWTPIGTDSTPAAWTMTFNFPNGAGHYQFYSVATDNDGNVQPTPLVAQANVQYNPTLIAQSISFGSLMDRALDESPFVAYATASSGLPVAFASLTSSVCTVSGSTVTLLATGTCSIAADQAGNAGYAPAPQVVRSFSVLLGQTITFAALTDRILGSGTFTVTATASSGLAVQFASLSTSVCSVSGNTVTLLTAGTCSIAADQAGNAIYAPAPAVVQSFTVIGATASDDGDVPLPAWALALLGAGLLGAIRQRARRAAA